MPSRFEPNAIAVKFKDNPQWYSAPEKLGDALRQGNKVLFKYVQKSARHFVITAVKVKARSETGPATKAEADGDRQARIEYQAARNAALEFLQLAVATEALPLGTKKGRMETLHAHLDFWTEKFYSETQSLAALTRIREAQEEGEKVSDEEYDPDAED